MGGDSVEARNRKRLKEVKMERLNPKDLLKWLDKCWSLYKTSPDEWKLAQQAYQQIEGTIKKEPAKEEFIEKKTTEIYNLLYYKAFSRKQLKDSIRSLVEEIQGVA